MRAPEDSINSLSALRASVYEGSEVRPLAELRHHLGRSSSAASAESQTGLGNYTAFSSFSIDTMHLHRDSTMIRAPRNHLQTPLKRPAARPPTGTADGATAAPEAPSPSPVLAAPGRTSTAMSAAA